MVATLEERCDMIRHIAVILHQMLDCQFARCQTQLELLQHGRAKWQLQNQQDDHEVIQD